MRVRACVWMRVLFQVIICYGLLISEAAYNFDSGLFLYNNTYTVLVGKYTILMSINDDCYTFLGVGIFLVSLPLQICLCIFVNLENFIFNT